MTKIDELKFDDENFNDHTEFGMSLLEKSLQEFVTGSEEGWQDGTSKVTS